MIRAKKWIIAFALGLRLLTSFEANALAQEPKDKSVAEQVAEINKAKSILRPRVKNYLGDNFLNAEEYASLKKGIENLIAKIKVLVDKKAGTTLAKQGKEEILVLEKLLADLKVVFEEDTAVIASVPELNQKKWWGKQGIYKATIDGKKALCFVVYNPSQLVGISRSLAAQDARAEIRKYLGSFGWAKMKLQMEFHEDEKKGGSWTKSVVIIEE